MNTKITEKLKRLKPIHYIMIFLGIVIYAGIIIGVVNYRSSRVVTPPRLDIITPVDGETSTADSISVQGQSEPRAELMIEGQEIKADRDGKYSATVPLSLGENSIKVSVEKGGQISERTLNVTRISPPVAAEPVITPESPSVEQLNNSGPETFWLLEAGTLTAAAAAYETSRRRLRKSFRS